MDKLKLPKKYMPEKSYSTPIRIRKSTQNLLDTVAEETGWNKIDVVEETGWNKIDVVEKMIEFAFDNIQWVTSDDYNKNNGGNE